MRGHVHCLVDVQPFVGPAEELRHGERALAVLVEDRAAPSACASTR
ncbi:MAG: hypothetical protein M5U28_18975 [Sandaracinaceae bacterium]|nr:hypothetical protein [Sandaracinaceae bacterium]